EWLTPHNPQLRNPHLCFVRDWDSETTRGEQNDLLKDWGLQRYDDYPLTIKHFKNLALVNDAREQGMDSYMLLGYCYRSLEEDVPLIPSSVRNLVGYNPEIY